MLDQKALKSDYADPQSFDWSKAEDLLIAGRCRLMTREPWYGHISMRMHWSPSAFDWVEPSKRTVAVRFKSEGTIQCIYYPPFVGLMNVEELYGVVEHEIQHLVRCHCVRKNRTNDPMIMDIAADMAVNGRRSNPYIGYKEGSKSRILPFKGELIYIPENWDDSLSMEECYKLLIKHPDVKSLTVSDDDGPRIIKLGPITGRMIDCHDSWDTSDVSEDQARQMVRNIVLDATSKCQGNIPGHLKDAIQSLNDPIVRWRDFLRFYVGQHVGTSRRTYSRRNRRLDRFGIKGTSHHAASSMNVIVDTSGSVSSDELEQFFSEIESMASYCVINILLWDADFQGYVKYRRGGWKNFPVSGRGGTDMAAPVKWLIDNRKVADVQVLLTDGACNWSPKQSFPMISVITGSKDKVPGPGWGHVVWLDMLN